MSSGEGEGSNKEAEWRKEGRDERREVRDFYF